MVGKLAQRLAACNGADIKNRHQFYRILTGQNIRNYIWEDKVPKGNFLREEDMHLVYNLVFKFLNVENLMSDPHYRKRYDFIHKAWSNDDLELFRSGIEWLLRDLQADPNSCSENIVTPDKTRRSRRSR